MLFDRVLDELNHVPCINAGGCGIAAYATYKWMRENHQLPSDFKFIFLYTCEDSDYKTNQAALKSKRKIGSSADHVVLYANGKYYDSKGEFDRVLNYSYQIVTDKPEFILRCINNVPKWNNDFKRQQVNNIAKSLKLDLSEIKINKTPEPKLNLVQKMAKNIWNKFAQ